MIYLDHSAAAPLLPEALEAMTPYMAGAYGNPSSLHRLGRQARSGIEKAREQVAELIRAEPREIVFTSGGVEANHLAFQALPLGAHQAPEHIVISSIEHPSVNQTAQRLAEMERVTLHRIACTSRGVIESADLEDAFSRQPAFLSLIWGNNETGALQPVHRAAQLAAERGTLAHTDAVQVAGMAPIDVRETPVHLLSLSAHKIGGPKGVGALYVRHGLRLAQQKAGGSQERGRRPGTENVPGIVGFGAACEIARRTLDGVRERIKGLRDAFETRARARIPSLRVNGNAASRLPHISNVAFPNREGADLLQRLDAAGVAASTGSACSSGEVAPSPTLLAMGQGRERALSAVRFSFGRQNTAAEIEQVVDILASILNGR